MTPNDARTREFREASERLLEDGVSTTLNDLSNALIVGAELMGRLRRRTPEEHDLGAEVRAMDAAISDAIVLTRELNTRLRIGHGRNVFTSVARALGELPTLLAPCLPPGVALSVKCFASPAIVAAPRVQVWELLMSLLEATIAGTGGPISAEFVGSGGGTKGKEVVIEVRGGVGHLHNSSVIAALADRLGGEIEFRTEPFWRVIVRIPSAR